MQRATLMKSINLLSTKYLLGTSILELISILSIIAISVNMSIPFLGHQLDRFTEQKNLLILFQALSVARNTAITQKRNTIFCPLTLTTPTIEEKKCSEVWATHFMIFIDLNNNNIFDNADHIIKTLSLNKMKKIKIAYNNTNNPSFNPRGIVNLNNGTLSFCDETHSSGIVISSSGRIRYATDYNKDGFSEITPGVPIC
jgi:type IV fimbrial biogenesis protein FimT